MSEKDLKKSISVKKGQKRICWDCEYIKELAKNCKSKKHCWKCSDYWTKNIPSHCSKGKQEQEELIFVKGYMRKDGVKVKGYYKKSPSKKAK